MHCKTYSEFSFLNHCHATRQTDRGIRLRCPRGYFINLSNWPVTKWEQWTYQFGHFCSTQSSTKQQHQWQCHCSFLHPLILPRFIIGQEKWNPFQVQNSHERPLTPVWQPSPRINYAGGYKWLKIVMNFSLMVCDFTTLHSHGFQSRSFPLRQQLSSSSPGTVRVRQIKMRVSTLCQTL